MDNVLFEIPIYLRSSTEYEKERLLEENKLKKVWDGEYAMGKKIEVKWAPWEYNDIIGYFKVIINSSSNPGGNINGIRVEKYFAKNKRIIRNPNQRRTKIWLSDPWFHKKLSIHNIQGCDTKQTLLKILESLYQDLSKTKNKTKRYYIDCRYYQNLIGCIDFDKIKMK
jgi:hypothetical protein